MHPRTLLPLAILAAPWLASGQSTTHIEFDAPRHFVTFAADKPPAGKPPEMQEHDGASADVPVPDSGSLYVWDRDTGNMVVQPVSSIQKTWHIAGKDLSKIGLVTVQVQYQGEPVAAANVTLKDAARQQSQIVDKSSDGEADFYAVQPGAITVTVDYRSHGEPASPVIQQFNLDLTRRTPDPLLTIALPNEVETVSSPTATTQAPARPAPAPKPAPRASLIGTLIVDLVSLAIAVFLAYYLYLLAMKHSSWLQARLSKLGIQVPAPAAQSDTADASQTPVAPLEPPKPKAPQKIILDNAAITPAAPVVQPHREPRLIKPTGEFTNLPQGETIVGRDDGLGLSLHGESSVSRRHASITRNGSAIAVKDLGSTNGTYVNGRRIDTETALTTGDDVQFGAVKFRLEG